VVTLTYDVLAIYPQAPTTYGFHGLHIFYALRVRDSGQRNIRRNIVTLTSKRLGRDDRSILAGVQVRSTDDGEASFSECVGHLQLIPGDLWSHEVALVDVHVIVHAGVHISGVNTTS